MTKKAQEGPGLIVTLISAVLILAIGFGIYIGFQSFAETRTSIDSVNSWVHLKTIAEGTDITVSQSPPVTHLQEPLEIRSEEDFLWHGTKDPKAYKELANSMIDCWNAFDRGNSDFINSMSKEKFCFSCRSIQFTEEMKRSKIKIIGFNRYLNEELTRGTGSPTYLQYLANDNAYIAEEADLINDEIIVDSDLHIFFVAASGRGWTNILTQVLGLGDVVEESVVNTEGTTVTTTEDIQAISSLSGAGTTGTLLTRQLLSERLAKASSEVAFTSAQQEGIMFELAEGLGTKGEQLTGAELKAALEAAEARGILRLSTTATTATTPQVIKGALGRTLGRVLSKSGVKLIAAKAAWPITIATGIYGGWQIIFGDKPFFAKVMIVDAKQVHTICNE